MKPTNDARRQLRKLAQKRFRGYPIATVCFYGPDDTRATKTADGIIPSKNAAANGEMRDMHRWLSNAGDIREDNQIATEILLFIKKQGARSVASTPAIIGCPHEEGIDYPEGEKCPRCPFWDDKDRWAKVVLPERLG